MVEKWEYKKETSEFPLADEEFIKWLNEEGQNGWGLIEYKAWNIKEWRCYYTCIFKRKIQQG